MSQTKQVKINSELHERVKQYVDSEDSTFSSMKAFYEQSVRDYLEKHKEPDNLTQDEIREAKRLIEKFGSD